MKHDKHLLSADDMPENEEETKEDHLGDNDNEDKEREEEEGFEIYEEEEEE